MAVTTSTKSWRDCTKAQLLEAVEVLVEQRDRALMRAAKAEAKAQAIEALFAGGPDTPCRTTWPHGVECVEIPLDDLRAALATEVKP